MQGIELQLIKSYSAWGVSNKKAPILYRMGLLAYFVTCEVEKSNFYKDLERVLDWEDSHIKSENQNENEDKQKRE